MPILEDKPVWGTTDETRTAYMDSRDVARAALAALHTDAAVGRTLALAGPQGYTTKEVIALCEQLADADAEVRNVPVWLLKGARALLRSLQWAGDAADRLAFAEVLSSNENFNAPMGETYSLLGIEPSSITTLEKYLQVGGLGQGARAGAGGGIARGESAVKWCALLIGHSRRLYGRGGGVARHGGGC